MPNTFNPRSINRPRGPRGYTLVELLLVMGIIIMVITLVLISVNAMLRGSRMARAVSLLVSSVDESRTSAITVRRTTRIDVTPLDDKGKDNRMTVFGTGASETFEQYKLDASTGTVNDPPQDPLLTAAWKSSGKSPILVADGTRCLKIRGLTASGAYWYRGAGVESVNVNDYYEAILFARIKVLPGTQRRDSKTMTVGILASIDDGGSRSIRSAYRLAMKIIPSAGTGRNDNSSVSLERYAGGSGTVLSKGDSKDGQPQVVFDQKSGTASPTLLLVEGIWYRVLLSVKNYTPQDGNNQPVSIVSGKLWADGQLEPLTYTVGPVTHKSDPLSNGFGGFSVEGCDAVVDDFLYDMRPVRLIPQGVTVTPLDPDKNYEAAERNSKYAFPLMFRPDGTTSVFSILEVADSTTGDKRYIRIDQNTGRARVRPTLNEVKK